MMRTLRLTFLSVFLASGATLAADPFDGMTMLAARGPAPVDVTLQWTGGQPTFKVYRAASPSGVVAPPNLIGESSVRSWIDTPPPGTAFFYVIKSPCVYNPPENCNGLDDDCDGEIDENNPGGGLSCSSGLPGVCSPGATSCSGGQIGCVPNVQPSAEVCDGLDNDCDGLTDEGNPGGGLSCNTGLPGVCGPGATSCSAGHVSCVQNVQPSAEVCDGADNDCDGQADSPPPPCNLAHAVATCTNGTCVVASCDSGYADCDTQPADGCETDTNTNAANCGSCSHVCDLAHASEVCTNGTCQIASCDSGYADCDTQPADGCETDTNTNAANCGSCSHVCDLAHASEVCTNGTCQIASCDSGYADCDTQPADGCETDTNTNAANCGSCSHVCDLAHASEVCTNGTCQIASCDSGYADCDTQPADGCETDTNTNAANCGSCSHVCDLAHASEVCTNGTCQIASCDSGYADCDTQPADGCETDTNTNAANCGSCSHVCDLAHASEVCTNGTCQIASCDSGYADCDTQPADGCETDTNTNAANCGSCSHVCDLAHASEVCTNGTCQIASCDSGYANCNGLSSDGCEANLNADPSNCGGCGQACEDAAACVSGACTAAVCSANSLWSLPISGLLPARIASSSSPTVPKLVYLAQDTTLYAVRRTGAARGTVSWTWTDPSANTINNFPSPVPMSMGGTYIFLGELDGSLYKINAEDGAQHWSVSTRRPGCSSDTLIATPTVQLYNFSNATFQADMNAHGRSGDDLVVVITKDQCGDTTSNRIIAYYASDGVMKWQFNSDLTHLMDYGSEGCALDSATNRLFCATEQTAGRPQNTLWCVNSIDGGLVWAQDAGSIRNRPQLKNGNLYVGTMTGVLTKRSAVDGSLIWRVPVGGPGVSITLPVWPEFRGGSTGKVLVVDSTGVLRAYNDLGNTANQIWSVGSPGMFTSMPVVFPSLGKVVVGRNDGKVEQRDLADGQLDASIFVGPGPVTAMALERDLGGNEIDRLTLASVGPGSGVLSRFCVPWVNGTGAPPQQPPCTSAANCANWAAPCDTAMCQSALGVCFAVESAEFAACANPLGCAPTSVCRGGVCDADSYPACVCTTAGDRACSTGTTCCGVGGGGGCVSLNSDPANCGGCGRTCGADQICSLGVCKRNTGISVCQATSSTTLNALPPGTLLGANSVAFDRQAGFCNAYLSGMGGAGQPSKLYRVDPFSAVASWPNPAADFSPLNGVDVSKDGRVLFASIANEVSGIPPLYTPGSLFVDPSVGSPSIPHTAAKTYANQPFTIQALNQGPVGPAIDTLSVTPGIGGARGFTAYFGNWSSQGDVVVAKRDCSIVPSCTWSTSPLPGWAPLPGQRITAIAFGVPTGGHRSLYIAHGTTLKVYDTTLFLVSRTVDLALAYTPVPGSGASVVKSVRSIAVDPLYGDLYLDVGDLGGKSQLLMMRIDDYSVRNVRHVQLDLGVVPPVSATFTTEGRIGVSPVKAMRIVPSAPGSTGVSSSDFGLCP